jgi:hypothetical protein
MTTNTNEDVLETEFDDVEKSEEKTPAPQPLTSVPVVQPNGNPDPYTPPRN